MAEYRQNTKYSEVESGEEQATEQPKAQKGSGNLRLPFGLCARYGITLPEGATPRDAWDALAGKGITPAQVYKDLKDGNKNTTDAKAGVKPVEHKASVTRQSIDEEAHQRAHDARSLWSEYHSGEATSSYNSEVSKFENNVQKLIDEYGSNETLTDSDWAEIERLTDAYGKRLAGYLNDTARNEASYPSWFVAGPARYNTKKNDALMARSQRLYEDNKDYINPDDNRYLQKIRDILTNRNIQSNDENAVGKLQAKLDKLKQEHETGKVMNAYWRKHGTMKGYGNYTDEQAERLDKSIKESWYGVPYPSFRLTNGLAEIKRVQSRIDEINANKERQASGETQRQYPQVEGIDVQENAELSRVQLRFDGKPDEETRNLLKHNGFVWSPSQGAWQRQLTSNGTRAAKSVMEELAKKQ